MLRNPPMTEWVTASGRSPLLVTSYPSAEVDRDIAA
jgi:hypothetical protein